MFDLLHDLLIEKFFLSLFNFRCLPFFGWTTSFVPFIDHLYAKTLDGERKIYWLAWSIVLDIAYCEHWYGRTISRVFRNLGQYIGNNLTRFSVSILHDIRSKTLHIGIANIAKQIFLKYGVIFEFHCINTRLSRLIYTKVWEDAAWIEYFVLQFNCGLLLLINCTHLLDLLHRLNVY